MCMCRGGGVRYASAVNVLPLQLHAVGGNGYRDSHMQLRGHLCAKDTMQHAKMYHSDVYAVRDELFGLYCVLCARHRRNSDSVTCGSDD